MWKDPEPDPGGDTQAGASAGKSSQDLSDLKVQNEQQQLLIAQLKEMLRKEQSNVTQEKVEEYINTLSKAKAKKNRSKKDESGGVEKSVSTSTSSVDVAKKQKLNLLKQQLEENKAKLAERGKSQKGIEEMVIQLKAQLNDSQQLIPANLSLIEHRNLDYSKHSSQEELYNILLTKERKITDLLNKVQKQEATIIDLEENLKEKDSVIDARTKAITLMTDSLSKKGKTTLDALDDTKEQMRKMQENFVKLEGEMKARQVKLLNDLKAKNLEITELQEVNQKHVEDKTELTKTVEESKEAEDYKNTITDLQKRLDQTLSENELHLSKIAELEKKFQDSVEDFNRLKNTGLSVDTEQTNDEEIAKLRKQLEENNKNMIKAKAQSKSKIKELNKKLDQIKKANDANALIVQLQNENTKLSEKIAELEEEKGNMQLKMVESLDSIKDSEEQKELENKLTKYTEELEEKDKVISLLETEIISQKQEINSLNEKISGLSHLENVQVSSELKSIQLEEQLEKAESENLKLKEEIEGLLRKKEEMAENIEELKKEKQDISSKLDNYIQENMELIDKLEKLSAEKVSSAESIEIVEGLTQQEKLELAAYQKTLDVHIEDEPIKCSEDDHIEQPTELNESVLQLGEDSTELLQKIDMFNMERKEVMTKMEALREEISQLNTKIKEVENNRDILAETYEQLQTEKELLQTENEGLLKKLQEAESKSFSEDSSKEVDDSESVVLTVKLQELQNKYEKLLAENEILKGTVKEYDRHVQEKHNLESELKQAKEKVKDLETKIRDSLEEINNYQSVIEENKNEFINSANLINDLQTKLQAREEDVADLNAIINELNIEVDNLRQQTFKLDTFEYMENEIAEFKTMYAEQIKKIEEYEEEIARNNDMNNDLNTKLIEINKKIIEAEHDMEMKDIEYKKLAEDIQTKDETNRELQRQLQDKDNKIGIVIQDMKEKYLSLQKKLDGNSGALEAKVMELTNKNREQMEKMKKIAANLKRKNQAYQELEEKYNVEKEKWETEVNEKQSVISISEERIATILHQLKESEEELNLKNAKLLDSDIKIRELTEIVENLEQNRVELQQSIAELKHREQKMTEVSLKQELSTSLHEDFDNVLQPNRDSVNEEKIKEMELIIETNEADIAHYRDRVHKLQENIARLEQEKESLVQKTEVLNDQLNITSKSVEEHSFVEEELGQKLLQVTANDEALTKTLEEMTEENKELNQKNKEIEEMNLKLKVKVKKAHERVTQLKTLQTNVEELETTNSELKKQLAVLEANQKQIQDENLELQKQNQNDYERIEADYQVQLEELVRCRNELTVECEKLRESLKEMGQREEELVGEIAEYKQKMAEFEANNKEKVNIKRNRSQLLLRFY